MKLAWVGLAGVMAVAGCKQNSNVDNARQEFAEERRDANQDLNAARQDAAKERAEIAQDLREKEANVRQDLAEDRQELAKTEAEGIGGSGDIAAAGTLTGVLTDADTDSITIKDEAGHKHDFKATAATKVMWEGKAVKLKDLKEGAFVSASYATQGEDKILSSVTQSKNDKNVMTK